MANKPVQIDTETMRKIAKETTSIPGAKIPTGQLPVPQKVLAVGKVLQLLDGLSLNESTWVLEAASRVLTASRNAEYKRRYKEKKLNSEASNQKAAGKSLTFSNDGEHEMKPV